MDSRAHRKAQRKLVLEGDDKYFTQSIQTFAHAQETGQDDSTFHEAPEPSVVPELEEFFLCVLDTKDRGLTYFRVNCAITFSGSRRNSSTTFGTPGACNKLDPP